ncbi:MAG: hypothetical protein HYZ28_03080 [Myxococcales bacterium]|nr:hypothetical protein [Myxococcales bacterium]
MKKLVLAALAAAPLYALAGPPKLPPPTAPEEPDSPEADSPERRERAARRMRLMMVVGLAESLELSEAEAVRLAERVRSFEDKRRPLREEMADSLKLLRRAAEGDSSALPQVDQSIQRILDDRAKLAALDKEMFNAVSRELSPQKRAKLALFLARFQNEARMMKAMRKHEGRRR